ncbi:hypothetical protein TNCV_3602051 [Trichonephila clavipes]|nr:hypothetical protein TNCV_3602051 [Trichonephila clavipes]
MFWSGGQSDAKTLSVKLPSKLRTHFIDQLKGLMRVERGLVEGVEWDICVSSRLSLKLLWSRQQRAFVVQAYFSNGRSVIAMQRAFRHHFDIPPRGYVPDRKYF